MAADALPPSADENGGAKPLCVTPTGSKKAKAAARKIPQMNGHDQLEKLPITEEHQFGIVYSRRRERAARTCFLEALLLDVELEVDGKGVAKRRRLGRGAE
ncbi:hypothetical protein C2S52_006027 [Perilla frutescens var. hirtella]|uniref:Uncharacterized protein n=1 Tax=Perilla frutescens var. hirtella TaxID=608512 RepID=A0AAD4JKS8_PERFH|nr:hypothetical protein C2S51_009738 [Perilla frutescens var. frutescens]KAH6786475.1 hypothetical protein C2S52_006027 [Perilla frutescens var. hirtella]KAH6834840.1 hypothetical protein C2S53_000925 [Perilla frutescens var. hirtella]